MTLKAKTGRSKVAKARKTLTPDQLFFYTHAGFSYDPKKETEDQGRIRCAKALAKAEEKLRNSGAYVEWSNDWDIGSHKDYYGKGSCYEDSEPKTCESAVLWDSEGLYVLASLGCIDDADSNYRRVIEAELAQEAGDKI
jgi:hypothetical protein